MYFFDFTQSFVEVEKGVKEQTIRNGEGLQVARIQMIRTGELRLYSAINQNDKIIARGDYDFVANQIRKIRDHLVEVAQMAERLEHLKQSKLKNAKEKESPEHTR